MTPAPARQSTPAITIPARVEAPIARVEPPLARVPKASIAPAMTPTPAKAQVATAPWPRVETIPPARGTTQSRAIERPTQPRVEPRPQPRIVQPIQPAQPVAAMLPIQPPRALTPLATPVITPIELAPEPPRKRRARREPINVSTVLVGGGMLQAHGKRRPDPLAAVAAVPSLVAPRAFGAGMLHANGAGVARSRSTGPLVAAVILLMIAVGLGVAYFVTA